jgi:hypothetical protein
LTPSLDRRSVSFAHGAQRKNGNHQPPQRKSRSICMLERIGQRSWSEQHEATTLGGGFVLLTMTN